MTDPFGFVVIDKPAGLTSHRCVSRLRRCYGLRRVGHGGTLDPSVTGVLPIALGPATRLLPYLPGDKTYRGIIQLGVRTSSDDLDGDVLERQPWPELTSSDLNQCLDAFRGPIQQTPPQVSAVHVDGERAHSRARRGEVMDLPARNVTIHRLQLLHWEPDSGQLELEVHCSSGTYIRSLARDLGDSLTCGGCQARLRRPQALGFDESLAHPLPEEGTIESAPTAVAPVALRHLPTRRDNRRGDRLALRPPPGDATLRRRRPRTGGGVCKPMGVSLASATARRPSASAQGGVQRRRLRR